MFDGKFGTVAEIFHEKFYGSHSTPLWSAFPVIQIPGAIGGKPICPKLGASVIRVSELIAADGRRWDEAALDQNLLFMDAQAVKSIPLGED